jgi:hypothetical protein
LRPETEIEIETAKDPGARGEKQEGREAEAADGEVGGKRSGFRPEVWNSASHVARIPSYTRLQHFHGWPLKHCDIQAILPRASTITASLSLFLLYVMEWDPSRFFRPEGSPSPYALLVLNQPINEKAFGVLSAYGETPLEEASGSVNQPQRSYMHIPDDQVLTERSADVSSLHSFLHHLCRWRG